MKKWLLAKCGGFEPVSNAFREKNPAKNPIDRIGSPPFSRIFNGWQSSLASVTLTAVEAALLDLRFAMVNGQNSRQIRPF